MRNQVIKLKAISSKSYFGGRINTKAHPSNYKQTIKPYMKNRIKTFHDNNNRVDMINIFNNNYTGAASKIGSEYAIQGNANIVDILRIHKDRESIKFIAANADSCSGLTWTSSLLQREKLAYCLFCSKTKETDFSYYCCRFRFFVKDVMLHWLKCSHIDFIPMHNVHK